jgi:hypothetical protein
VLNVEGQEQLKELAASEKNYAALLGEVQKLSAKFKAGGLSDNDMDVLNDAILKLEGRFMKSKKQGAEMMSLALGGQKRLSQHDLEKKIERRRKEIGEVEKIITDIGFDNNNVRTSMMEELAANQGNDKMGDYCNKLKEIIEETDNIENEAKSLTTEKDSLYEEWSSINASISQDPKMRLKLYIRVLNLKKRITKFMILIRTMHTRVKTVFTRANAVFGLKPKEAKPKPAFKAVKGDEVDELVAFYLTKTGMTELRIERLGGGYYMFGTKKIYCKIINGKLVVRVGGGYMGMEEFINTYGQQEVNKWALLHGGEVTAKWTEDSGVQKSKVGVKGSSSTVVKGSDSPSTQRSETSTGPGFTETVTTTSTFKKPIVKK